MMREKEGWYKEKNSLLFLLNRKTPPPPLPHSKYNITKKKRKFNLSYVKNYTFIMSIENLQY